MTGDVNEDATDAATWDAPVPEQPGDESVTAQTAIDTDLAAALGTSAGDAVAALSEGLLGESIAGEDIDAAHL